MNSKNRSDIVITGMSGRFPESGDIHQFKDNLFNKMNMISDDNRRWNPNFSDIPHKTGKIPEIEKFDSGFFGINQILANNMDPTCRLLLECVFEAILDAGRNPLDLEGTKTGVYVGAGLSETENVTFFNNLLNSSPIIGCQRSMLAKNISYFFKLNGPSIANNTACNSSMSAIEAGYTQIKNGSCEKAIVCSAQVCLDELVSLECARMGVLCFDGKCKSFDDAADGYVRSEAIVVIVLEKLKDAKRVYAEVLGCKINCDGYTEESITFPSHEMQEMLLKEIYEECQIDPNLLSFFEAHGTGTKVGDIEELKSVGEIICKKRYKPLHIGSVKSNMGHAEGVSGLCSVIKILIGFEYGYIPPNMHYNTPKKGAELLEKGRLIVVTEKIPWPDNNGLAAVNNFGFGGVNGHVILRWNKKIKENNGIPEDNLPRLICASGRTEETVFSILDNSIKMDVEFISLIHGVFRKVIPNQLYNGYSIITKQGELERVVCKSTHFGKKIRIVFNNIDEDWINFGETMKNLPIYSKFYQKVKNISQKVFKINGVKPNKFYATITSQLILADLIKELNLEFTEVIGIGYGKLVAAYLDGYLSIEDAILVNYYFLSGKMNKVLHDKKWLQERLLETISNSKEFKDLKENLINLVIGPELKFKSDNNITLINVKDEEPIMDLLRNFGKLFNLGHPVDLNNLYPTMSYPVSRSTPMISPLIKWHHANNYTVHQRENVNKFKNQVNTKQINTTLEKYNFLNDFIIDGKKIFPPTGYLQLIWSTYNTINNNFSNNPSLVFEDIKFLKECIIPEDGILTLTIIMKSKEFEIFEKKNLLVTGKCYTLTQEDEISSKPNDKEKIKINTEMDEKDVYKELRLKGYYYGKQFKCIKNFNYLTNTAMISWTENWITFLDNMLQIQLLSNNTRNLFVPSSINRIVLNGSLHLEILEKAIEFQSLPVTYYKNLNRITSGAIEIIGLKGDFKPKTGIIEPVLEINKFVPFHGNLKQDEAVKCIIETILENATAELIIKSIELLNKNEDEPLMPLVKTVLDNLPLIQDDLKIITIEDDIDSYQQNLDCFIFIGKNITQNSDLLKLALQATKKASGFIISKENKEIKILNSEIQILSSYQTEYNQLLLIKESSKSHLELIPLNISSMNNLSWIKTLQSYQKTTYSKKIVLYSENNSQNGLLGLSKCLLKELSIRNISVFIIMDDSSTFNIENDFYKLQLEKNLVINILKNGKWGTYTHLFLPEIDLK